MSSKMSSKMSQQGHMKRILLHYKSINEEGLKELDGLIYAYTEADVWLFHDSDNWNAMVLVTPKKKFIESKYFNRGAIVDQLRNRGYGEYEKIHALRIDRALEGFIKRPNVKMVLSSPEGQEYYDSLRVGFQGDLDSKNEAQLFTELRDEACDYVRAGLTQKDFYAKHEKHKAKANILMTRAKTFQGIWDNFPTWKEIKKPEYSLEASMQIYLGDNELPENTDYIKIIKDAGHGKCLEAIYRIFFERKDPKKNLVWLYGAPNSGKTTLIKHLETIFCTQEFNFQDKYCTVLEPSKSDQEVQLLTSKEFEVDHAFSGVNYTSFKQMGEGLGATVSVNKFKEYKLQFVGKQFVVASNKIPACSNSFHTEYCDKWEPMLSRMEVIYLDQGFPGETAFPYTAAQLAAALTQMINRDFENQNPAQQNEDRLDLCVSVDSNQDPEEIKKEETFKEAEESGNMNFFREYVGDLGGSQQAAEEPRILSQPVNGLFSQPVNGKRKRDIDLESLLGSMQSKRVRR